MTENGRYAEVSEAVETAVFKQKERDEEME